MAKNSVELIDDSNEYCSETDEAALDVKVSNRGKTTINCLDRSWDNVLGTLTTEHLYGTLPNEYFLPDYFQEIKENKQGTVTLWTNLCLGSLQRLNSNYKYEITKGAKRTIFTDNLASGQIEGYFANLKINIGFKQPILYFVKKSYQSLLWEQRRYFDWAVHGSQDLNRDLNNKNSQEKKTRNIEEGWYKGNKKKKKRKPKPRILSICKYKEHQSFPK